MPDICDLILDEHETLRRRFAELDEHRANDNDRTLAALWTPLGELLELHAATEETIFYPALLGAGACSDEETEDAIKDHNQIRDAVERAGRSEIGGRDWWLAVDAARRANSDHMGEEERGALADLRSHTERDHRERLGAEWQSFSGRHAGMSGLEARNQDPGRYIDDHGG